MNSAEHYTTRYLETDDLDQYNALLRYTFQVTEEELTATGWKDDEIKQSKFPVLERADVLGCFDGDTLVSQFAVYPLKMNIYDEVYHVGFVTSVCTYPEYTGQGIMKKLMIQGLTRMYEEARRSRCSTPTPSRCIITSGGKSSPIKFRSTSRTGRSPPKSRPRAMSAG